MKEADCGGCYFLGNIGPDKTTPFCQYNNADIRDIRVCLTGPLVQATKEGGGDRQEDAESLVIGAGSREL